MLRLKYTMKKILQASLVLLLSIALAYLSAKMAYSLTGKAFASVAVAAASLYIGFVFGYSARLFAREV